MVFINVTVYDGCTNLILKLDNCGKLFAPPHHFSAVINLYCTKLYYIHTTVILNNFPETVDSGHYKLRLLIYL